MELRMNPREANPDAYQMMQKLEGYIKSSGLDRILYELIKIRTSQINGCAFCLDMHTSVIRKMGESEQRVYLVSVWRDTPYFTDKERVVLELTEAVTQIANNGVSQSLYEKVNEHFTDEEYVTLIMAINTINCWNRIMISTGMFPGCNQ
ncbi:carboxymuconolactone decarboxylase family protein [Paenibacillus albiflavus]|uniref:Carboxymuconolactone decarboxylase family protein n=1 Tax=Paenibacillus albiflavus TaxID=2545760 RepID=A0A4R4EMT2_9BACL|nr:carboxymuconolactone decarboxylase family protein [Paenibacillus albiflavus]TCZ80873.1 carboxymuconolactone decarboxylase family protein [Paenibacillus albiflavus]